MADRLVALPGLRRASWRGIGFHVYDLNTPAGRRLMSMDLPGTDATIHEDLGLANAPIRVNGIILGDDIKLQALALEAAFNEAGPGTLVHPWFGARTCILADTGAEIRFEPNLLRGLRFQASFLRWDPSGAAAVSTLASIATAADVVTSALTDLIAIADELVAGEVADTLASAWGSVLSALELTPVGASLLTVAASTSIGGTSIATAATRIGDAAGAVAWIGTSMATLAGAGVPPKSPAIGVGPTGRASEAAVDPYGTVKAMLAIGETLAAEAADSDSEGRSLAIIAAALGALAAMIDPLAAVAWESRQQAEAARAAISTAIGAAARAVIQSVDGSADAAAKRQAAWRALGALRRRIHEDLDDRIGRLPSVLTIVPPTRVNAWLVAQYVSGDDPKAVQATFEDIVKRNGLPHPALIQDAAVEVLPPSGSTTAARRAR